MVTCSRAAGSVISAATVAQRARRHHLHVEPVGVARADRGCWRRRLRALAAHRCHHGVDDGRIDEGAVGGDARDRPRPVAQRAHEARQHVVARAAEDARLRRARRRARSGRRRRRSEVATTMRSIRCGPARGGGAAAPACGSPDTSASVLPGSRDDDIRACTIASTPLMRARSARRGPRTGPPSRMRRQTMSRYGSAPGATGPRRRRGSARRRRACGTTGRTGSARGRRT